MTRTGSLIFLYGPPGAGKLTVAKALADAYDLRIIDNHVSLDPALRLFEFGTEELFDLVTRLRVELIGAGARAGLDVVSTFVYGHPIDRDHVAQILGVADEAGARVTRVQLLPPRAVLEQRVLDESRHDTTKIGDVALLRSMFEQYDMETPIDPSDLSIDNSEIAPSEVARLIGETAGLTPATRP
jgi:hypothetical protein